MEQDRFGRFISDAERAGGRLLEQIGDKMVEVAKKEAPVRTGRLKRSIRSVMLSNNREVRVFSDVPYAGVMEYGSRPHRIHGVRANFDWKGGRFVWNDPKYGPIGEDFDPYSSAGGQEASRRGHYRRQQQRGTGRYGKGKSGYLNWTYAHGATVNHPGTEGVFYFRAAWESVWPTARVIMRRVYAGN